MIKALIWLLLGYAVGSVNPSYLLSQLRGFDIRNKGTGNAGATNVMFVLGFKYGLCIMLADILKTYGTIRLAMWQVPENQQLHAAVGVAVAVGHIFPFYLHFKGGKGTACLCGIILALTPAMLLPMAAGVFIIGAIFNYASILPLLAVVFYPFIHYFSTGSLKTSFIVALLIPLMLWSHRGNFAMHKNGEESGFRQVIFGKLDQCIERQQEIQSNKSK